VQYVSLEWAAWMVATFSLYWLAPPQWRQWVLVALTAAFLALLSPLSTAILIGFTCVTWLIARQKHVSGWHVLAAVLTFILALGYFKWGARGQAIQTIVTEALVPLGMSYYTFRCLHLIIERYLGRFQGTRLDEIVGYLFFLPTLVVGPIHRFGDYQRDLYRTRLSLADIGAGAERILYGYVKIGFLGNYLVTGHLGTWISELPPEQAALAAYLTIVKGGLNLYFQFSGFADIAIGFARLLGFRVIENFNWPYLKQNLSEYWRSWHISLTSWCRDYIYTPVVSHTRSPALGALATLLAIGLWHELSLKFVLWGFYHGFGLIVWQQFQIVKQRFPAVTSPALRLTLRVLSTIFTVHYVWFGFALVEASTLREALDTWIAATIGFFR
jgi:D-alanyl-lipoteichoic acid acyltransferase DltB (MBOAT superfamily)